MPVAGAVIVTTPQDIALADARKGLKMFEKVNVPVLGIVENMSVHVCSNCGHVEHLFGAGGGARMAAQYGVELLGELPLDARVREEADGGVPTVVAAPDSPHAAPYFVMARRTAAALARRAQGSLAPCFRRSSSKKARGPHDEHQVRPLDPPHGGAAQDDRAVRRASRCAGRRPARSSPTARRAMATTCAVRASSRSSPTSTRPSSIRRISTRRASSTCTRDVCIIPPNSFALARTVEYFRIPRSTLVVCLGKSTYARCGIIVNVTPLEPEWEGHVTLEFSNTTPLPAKIYANEGVAQMLFFESDEVCSTSYKDRGGKYQGQTRRHAAEDLRRFRRRDSVTQRVRVLVSPTYDRADRADQHLGLPRDALGLAQVDSPARAPPRCA